MRLLITLLAALRALPTGAETGTIGVEGSALVQRADPGADDAVSLVDRPAVISRATPALGERRPRRPKRFVRRVRRAAGHRQRRPGEGLRAGRGGGGDRHDRRRGRQGRARRWVAAPAAR